MEKTSGSGREDLTADDCAAVYKQSYLDACFACGIVSDFISVAFYPLAAIPGKVKTLPLLERQIVGIGIVEVVWDKQFLRGNWLGGYGPAQFVELGHPVIVVPDAPYLSGSGHRYASCGQDDGSGSHHTAAQQRDPSGQQFFLWYPCGNDKHKEYHSNPLPGRTGTPLIICMYFLCRICYTHRRETKQ